MTTMLNSALEYLDRGWSVIPMLTAPVDNARKRPYIRWKPYQLSRPTREEVELWWSRWVGAGIGVILGPVSGVVAVDVDSIEAEEVFFDLVEGEPKTLKTLSGSRKPAKAHYLFRCPHFPTNARFTPLHPKLEFRGHGGYVVGPPSLHPSGNRYEFADPMQEVAELPEPLVKVWQSHPRLRPQQRKQDAGRQHQDFGVSPRARMNILKLPGLAESTQRWLIGDFAYDDGWNCRLFCAACDLAGLGISRDVAEPLLLSGAMPRTNSDEDMARRTIESAFSAPRTPFRDFQAESLSHSTQSDSTDESVRIIVPPRHSRRVCLEVR